MIRYWKPQPTTIIRFFHGKAADDELRERAAAGEDVDVGRKLVYTIVDAGIVPADAADSDFHTFASAAVYVGKGEGT